MKTTKIKLALQRKGRLAEASLTLLRNCGIEILSSRDSLFGTSSNFPIEFTFVRDDDIPALLRQGTCDLGMLGADVYYESQYNQTDLEAPLILKELGLAKCKLSLALPKASVFFESEQDLNFFLQGKKIATSFPGILERYLRSQRVEAQIISMKGSVEAAPALGIADLVCDLVSSGATLRANGLKPVQAIFESQALLLRAPEMSEAKQEALDNLLQRIEGVFQARRSKYIMLNAPKSALEKITRLLPGASAPTVIPLPSKPDFSAVQAVCQEEVFWETMQELKKAGASDILVLPIEKMMP